MIRVPIRVVGRAHEPETDRYIESILNPNTGQLREFLDQCEMNAARFAVNAAGLLWFADSSDCREGGEHLGKHQLDQSQPPMYSHGPRMRFQRDAGTSRILLGTMWGCEGGLAYDVEFSGRVPVVPDMRQTLSDMMLTAFPAWRTAVQDANLVVNLGLVPSDNRIERLAPLGWPVSRSLSQQAADPRPSRKGGVE